MARILCQWNAPSHEGILFCFFLNSLHIFSYCWTVYLKVDGNLTLNEDVADIGAAKAIVATLTRLDCQNGPDPYLPGLTKYTHEQTMLINAAQVS